MSHRVHAIADDCDHTEDHRRQPQLAEYSAPASPLGPRAHTSIFRSSMTSGRQGAARSSDSRPPSQLVPHRCAGRAYIGFVHRPVESAKTAASSCAADTSWFTPCQRAQQARRLSCRRRCQMVCVRDPWLYTGGKTLRDIGCHLAKIGTEISREPPRRTFAPACAPSWPIAAPKTCRSSTAAG